MCDIIKKREKYRGFNMSIRKVLKFGDPFLREKAKEVMQEVKHAMKIDY